MVKVTLITSAPLCSYRVDGIQDVCRRPARWVDPNGDDWPVYLCAPHARAYVRAIWLDDGATDRSILERVR